MKAKAELFFFGIFFIAALCIVFSVIKQTNSPVFKKGLLESSEVMTKQMR